MLTLTLHPSHLMQTLALASGAWAAGDYAANGVSEVQLQTRATGQYVKASDVGAL